MIHFALFMWGILTPSYTYQNIKKTSRKKESWFNSLYIHLHSTCFHDWACVLFLCTNTATSSGVCTNKCHQRSHCTFSVTVFILFTCWWLAIAALPGYRFIILQCLISTAAQATAIIRQDLAGRAQSAVPHAGTMAALARRVASFAIWFLALWILEQQQNTD